MRRLFPSFILVSLAVLLLSAGPLPAQSTGYTQTNLTSDGTISANNKDTNLINPWGVTFIPGNPFWISDNNKGVTTLYNNAGVSQSAPIVIPPPSLAAGGSLATPTGIVANNTAGFQVNGAPAVFIFSTEDGTISAWNSGGSAVLIVDNPNFGTGLGTDSVYKGLAMVTNSTGTFLLATNFRNNSVDVFDSTFKSTTLSGTFTDTTIPPGYAPFGVHVIGTNVFVTYALQDSAKHDPMSGPGNGFVSMFDMNGNFVSSFASQGHLNSPWGVVQATANFGQFSNDILVGNFGDGMLNAFDPKGNFVATVSDSNGNPLVNPSLWDLVFDTTGMTGAKDTLYFTAGLANEAHGLFGNFTVAQAPPPESIVLGISPGAITVKRGGTGTTMVSAGVTPSSGNPMVTFSCSGLPGGATCAFSPATITISPGVQTPSTLTISAAATGNYGIGIPVASSRPIPPSRRWPLAVAMAAFLIAILSFARLRNASRNSSTNAPRWARIIIAGGLLAAAAGCGYNKSGSGTPIGTTTVMVTATSGSVTASVPLTLTVQ
jgi:uncharacterized protein (TIGR03118 family)